MSKISDETKDEIHLIQFLSDINSSVSADFLTSAKNWVALRVKAHVLDFKNCESIDPQFFRAMIWFKQQALSLSKKVYSTSLNKNLIREIQSNGLDSVFNSSPDRASLLAQISGKKSATFPNAQSVEFIKAFVGAVNVAVTTQANTPLKPGKPFTKKGPLGEDIGIAGVISLVSPHFLGSISLLFPTPVFLSIYENMLGEKLQSITKESEDAAGELLNIIFGLAKMRLNNEKGFSIQKAIPTVLVGEKIRVADSNLGSSVLLPFETQAGSFFLEVIFEQSIAA